MQDLQRRLGLGKARCRREVWRNHYEHASDTGKRSRESIHVVVVGFEELRTLLLPLCRLLEIPYDSSNLLALCKKRARNGTAYIPSDSHDCIHMTLLVSVVVMVSIVVMGDVGQPKWRLSQKIRIKLATRAERYR